MHTEFEIVMVSDVSCPWCAIGLAGLEHALRSLRGEISARIRLEPFELNPAMPAGGQDIDEHIAQKYGSSPAARAAVRGTIRQRGADLGFEFAHGAPGRIYNTFDAHRLLHWAGESGDPEGVNGEPGAQRRLKWALFNAYFGRDESLELPSVLLAAVHEAGLDTERARDILAGDDEAQAVRAREAYWREQEVHAVPAFIVERRHLIPGGQPPEVFERILRRLAARREDERSDRAL